MKSRNHQPRLLYPAKLLFRIKGQTKSFPDKKKLKEFIITKPLFYDMLKGLIFKKMKTINNKMAKNIQSNAKQGPTAKIALPSKAIV